MRALLVVLLAGLGLGLGLGLAATAQAGRVTIGSSLKAKARRAQSAPVDSVYWNTRLAGRRRVRVPRRGELDVVSIKGRVVPSGMTPPNVAMLAQVLRPVGGGRVKAIVTSLPLHLPYGGSPQRVTRYDLQQLLPYPMCVRKGDYVALATNGGFGPQYPDGAVFRMFGVVGGSAFRGFTGAGKDMDGSVLRGRTRPHRELLMRTRIITGRAAAAYCRS